MLPKPYYSDEQAGITLYNARCEQVLPFLPNDIADLTLCDPPYETETHDGRLAKFAAGGDADRQRKLRAKIGNVEQLPFAAVTEVLRFTTAEQIARLTKRWSLTFCQIEGAATWRLAYQRAGLRYMRTCIWVKPDGLPQLSGDRPGMGYETLLATHRKGKTRWNGGGRHGVFIFPKGDGTGLPHLHPTQKPLKLIKELVLLFSNPGELILDPFAGSCTLLLAAKQLGRRAIACEMDEKYCEVGARRLKQEMLPFEPARDPTQTMMGQA